VRDTLSSAANDARVARLRGVGLTFGDATATPTVAAAHRSGLSNGNDFHYYCELADRPGERI
jgi:hypothetical protein